MKVTELRLYTGVKIDENNVVKLTPANLLTSLNTYLLKTYTNLSLVLENFALRIPENYFSIMQVNYMAFRENTNTRWFFARVEKLEYVSDVVTKVKFTIDYWQTYYSEISLLDCFVEREITASDNIGENTLDEGLDVGRVESILTTEDDFGTGSACYIAIMSDWNPKTNPEWWDKILDTQSFSGITIHNNLVSGHQIFIIKIRTGYESTDYLNLLLFILECNKDGHIADLHDIFILPNGAIDDSTLVANAFNTTIGETSYVCSNYLLPFSYSPKSSAWNVAKIKSFTDFSPRNAKCFCYPYNYLFVTNNVGNQNIYKYEDFADDDNAEFLTEFAVCIGGSGRVVPKDFKGVALNYDESLPLAKFPVCGWSADSFTNWLTQNAINITSQIVSIGAGIITGATVPDFEQTASGELKPVDVGSAQAGIGVSVVGKITNLIGQFRTASLMPNIQGGSQNNGDVNYSGGNNTFKFNRMRCKLENLRVIDDYFTKFGYKIARVKTPNLTTSRFNHFYVKTGQGEKAVAGNIPKDGLDIINKQFSNGITVWKTLAGIGNYS